MRIGQGTGVVVSHIPLWQQQLSQQVSTSRAPGGGRTEFRSAAIPPASASRRDGGAESCAVFQGRPEGMGGYSFVRDPGSRDPVSAGSRSKLNAYNFSICCGIHSGAFEVVSQNSPRSPLTGKSAARRGKVFSSWASWFCSSGIHFNSIGGSSVSLGPTSASRSVFWSVEYFAGRSFGWVTVTPFTWPTTW